MKITAEKMQSTLFLKIVFAILISAMPFLGALSENAGFFLMIAVLTALLGWRIYETKKIYMPKISIIAFIFFIYNLITFYPLFCTKDVESYSRIVQKPNNQ